MEARLLEAITGRAKSDGGRMGSAARRSTCTKIQAIAPTTTNGQTPQDKFSVASKRRSSPPASRPPPRRSGRERPRSLGDSWKKKRKRQPANRPKGRLRKKIQCQESHSVM